MARLGYAYSTKNLDPSDPCASVVLDPGKNVEPWEITFYNSRFNRHMKDCGNTHLSMENQRQCPCGFKYLALENLQTLVQVIKWNAKNNKRVFILPMTLFPHAADLYNGYSIEFAKHTLQQIGVLVKKMKMRLAYVIPDHISELFGSPFEHDKVLYLRHLYHCSSVLNTMQLDRSALVIMRLRSNDDGNHCFHEALSGLRTSMRLRVAFVNGIWDHLSVEHLLPICEREKVPLVLDIDAVKDGKLVETRKSVERLFKRLHVFPLAFHSSSEGFQGFNAFDIVLFKNAKVDVKDDVKDVKDRYAEGRKVLAELP